MLDPSAEAGCSAIVARRGGGNGGREARPVDAATGAPEGQLGRFHVAASRV